ncbi:hypothetical protein [Streptomyces zaomyceticus]|uniref:hypothetical protein n=1 Tax=Streptomyces zaomyceticus TaxID=68286 RepID=UPI0036AE052E
MLTDQTRRALDNLAYATPEERTRLRAAAEEYLSQVDRRCLPLGYNRPIPNDGDNRSDAFHMRRGDTIAHLLHLHVSADDAELPHTARAVLHELDASVRELITLASITGQPSLIAVAHLVGCL